VYAADKRAGYVYINVIDEPPFGRHPSIQIHINQSLRGRGIGKVAYRLACEQSRHDVVIAHMRKNNTASQRAAAAAGFVIVNDTTITQLAMRWSRPTPSKPA
jgi:RimJ/RimL family protein N-acetyltransferase